MTQNPQLKPAYSGWISHIPAEWTLPMLKRVSSIQTGLTLGKHYEGALLERPYLRVANVQDGSFDLRKVTTIEVPPEIAARVTLRAGDVLMTEGGDLDKLGRGTVWDDEITDCLHQNHIFAVRCFQHRLSPTFLAYLTSSKLARDYFEATGKRTTNLASTNSTKVGELPVPLPPLPEQQRIAAYLDASCAAIDAAVAAKRRQLETLDTIRSSIIRHAVTRGLNRSVKTRPSSVPWFGEIPQNWQDGHLKRYARRIQTGVTPPTDTPEYYEDGTIPWFAPGSFGNDIKLTEPRKLINERARREGVLRMFPAGSVFVIGIGATIGKVGIIADEASCNQQIVGIVCDHRMTAPFLAYQLKIYEVVIPGICVATTLPIFNQVQIGYLPVVVPPVSEQRAICDYIDTKLGELKKVVVVLESQIHTLASYRKSLIHECVTGQRRITEAEVRAIQTCMDTVEESTT